MKTIPFDRLPAELQEYISTQKPRGNDRDRYRQYISGKQFFDRFDLDHVQYCAAANALADRLRV